MRTKIKTVPNPMVIRAEILEYRPSNLPEKTIQGAVRILRIKISTEKIQTQLERTGIVNHKEVFRYTQKPLWTTLQGIPCHRNRKTHYKDFIYLLRNPHASIMFVNSEIRNLKILALSIIKGYKIIFPRETRYYSEIKNKT